MTVEYGWPLGMPMCRHLEGGVHGFSGTITVYHAWYNGGREYSTELRN
jgi:hypothetical protein